MSEDIAAFFRHAAACSYIEEAGIRSEHCTQVANEIELLREALKPFANEIVDDGDADSDLWSRTEAAKLTVGDFRRASRALLTAPTDPARHQPA